MADVTKQRQRRGEALPDGAAFVVRGDLLVPATLAESAQENHVIYGFYGVSVFAEVGGLGWEDIASTKLRRATWLVLFTARALLTNGLDLWDANQAPHDDIVHGDLDELAGRIPWLRASSRLQDSAEAPTGCVTPRYRGPETAGRRNDENARDLGFRARAGDGNRTRVLSLGTGSRTFVPVRQSASSQVRDLCGRGRTPANRSGRGMSAGWSCRQDQVVTFVGLPCSLALCAGMPTSIEARLPTLSQATPGSTLTSGRRSRPTK